MAKLSQEYINLKIKNCEELVKSATSEPQREIYQGYLEHWIGQTTKKPKEEPQPKELEIVIEPVVVPEPIPPNNKAKCSICGKEISVQNIARHERACKKAKLERELESLKEIIEIEPEVIEPEPVEKPESTEKTNI